MKTQEHQEIYRVAFQTANSELIEINEAFEKLRIRMEQVERLVAALKPLVYEQDEEEAVETPAEDPTAEHLEVASEASEEEAAPEPVRVGADPFQHRISHVLGIGAGIRDVRSYTRQF